MDREMLAAIESLLDVKLHPLAEELAQVKSIAVEARDMAKEARDMAIEAKNEAKEARNMAKEARDVAIEAKNEAREARIIAQEARDEARQTRVLVEMQDKKLNLLCEAQEETRRKFRQLDKLERTLYEVKSEVEVMADIMKTHAGELRELKNA